MKKETNEDNNVEVCYTVPVEAKIMIRESKIKDWEDEEEIKDYIDKNCDIDNATDRDEISIISIG